VKQIRTIAVTIALAIVMTAVAFVSGAPASSAAAPLAAPAARTLPCGHGHYPPCPPKNKPTISIGHYTVRRGHFIGVFVRHFRPNLKVTVYLGRRIIAQGRTGRKGNASLGARVPWKTHVGYYTLWVHVGSKVKTFRIHVVR
jgi:hypothetical protein